MTGLNKSALIDKYLSLRDEVAQIEARAKEAAAPIKETMDKIERYFKALAAEEGVDSWKTESGTAYLQKNDSVKLADPAAFMEFVVANEAWDLIEKRAAKVAVRGFLESNGVLPPGAEISTRVEVVVRQPSNK